MSRTAMILGAIGVAASIGVAAGSTVPTEPIAKAADPLAELPDHAPAQAAYQPRRNTGPNHYALETPEGRVEVHELADHGLYRNKRYAAARYYYGGGDADQVSLEAEHPRPVEGAGENTEATSGGLPVTIIGPSPSGSAPVAVAPAAVKVKPMAGGERALEAQPTGIPVQTANLSDSGTTGNSPA